MPESEQVKEARLEAVSALSVIDDMSYTINTDHDGMLIEPDELFTFAADVIGAAESIKEAAKALEEAIDEDYEEEEE